MLTKTFSGQSPDPVAVSSAGNPFLCNCKSQPGRFSTVVSVKQSIETVARTLRFIKNAFVIGGSDQPEAAAETVCRRGTSHSMRVALATGVMAQ